MYQAQTYNQYDAQFRQPYLNGLANDTSPNPAEGMPTQAELEEMMKQQMRTKGYSESCIATYMDLVRKSGGDPNNLSSEERAWAEKVASDPSACNSSTGESGDSFLTQDVDIFGAKIPVWALLLAGAAGTWYILSD